MMFAESTSHACIAAHKSYDLLRDAQKDLQSRRILKTKYFCKRIPLLFSYNYSYIIILFIIVIIIAIPDSF